MIGLLKVMNLYQPLVGVSKGLKAICGDILMIIPGNNVSQGDGPLAPLTCLLGGDGGGNGIFHQKK